MRMRNGKGGSLDNRGSNKKIGESQRPHPPKTEGGAPGDEVNICLFLTSYY